MSVSVVWLKRDLRLRDHAPLVEAARHGPVVVLYVFEPDLWAREEYDGCHFMFIRQSLEELDAGLKAIGGRVTYRTGRMLEVLESLRESLAPHGGIRALYSHQETGIGWTFGRDKAVAAWVDTHGIPWLEAAQDGVFRRLPSRDGWAGRWEKRMSAPLLPAPERIETIDLDPGVPPEACDLGLEPSTADPEVVQSGGESEAHRVLQSFLKSRVVGYSGNMSSPITAEEGCSRLSPHLAWGTVSVRTVHQHTERRRAIAKRNKDTAHSKSLSSFAGRLRWRCHFMQKLESEPALEFHALQRAADDLREPLPDPERFEAWCAGRTGFPMVDAVMRQLHAQKWTSFRMRALLVSVASYTLWLDWRPCAAFLAKHFLDFEPGIHYSQFQMQSGVTGINSLRIYNPVKQGKDHDPNGEFIRRWVPELRRVQVPWIHEPWTLPPMLQTTQGCRIGVDYPEPIVDPVVEAKRARAKIEAMRKTPIARAQSEAVFIKHGSRKGPQHRRR